MSPPFAAPTLQAQKQGAAGGEGQLLESVLKEELRFEAEETAKAHGGAGTTARPDKPNAAQVGCPSK